MDEEDYPHRIFTPKRAKSEQFDEKLVQLIEHRNEVAEKLDIEPSYIASRSVLESIAENEEEGKKSLLKWQLGVLNLG
jgi:ribonuclease D